MRRVVVAVSGGVDSSVAALLLKKKGFDVTGAYMRYWDDGTTQKDAEDAEFACKNIGINFKEVSFNKEYRNDVLNYALDTYQKGFIPNPDVMCNKKIKFGYFFNYAVNVLGADAMATGHYARTTFGPFLEHYKPATDVSLLRASDLIKDETFFLSQVPQDALRKTMFPIGELKKTEVRQIAIENGLERIERKGETVAAININKFVGDHINPKPGKFVNISTGSVEGEHEGNHLWAVGQKIRLAGVDQPRYVLRKLDQSTILVGSEENHPVLFTSLFLTGNPHWITKSPDLNWYHDCEFLFRHDKSVVQCRLIALKSGELFVTLKKPLSRMNPGQFAVFYSGDVCLGSAEILKVGPSHFSLGKKVNKGYREYNEVLNASG